jgi:hypothetical protein
MKHFSLKYFLLIIFIFPDSLFGQAGVTVTKPRLELSDANLIIQYDILNSQSSDFFIVWIEVSDAAGNKIKALSVNGDVGKDIKGGKNKRITWNFGNDSIYIDEDLFVEVKAEKVILKEETAKTIDVPETREETKTVKADESTTGMKEISKGNMILSSVALPGWGQTKTKKGKPYWIIGAAGYGCLTGSVLLNRSASSAYDDYKKSMDLAESNALFDKALQRNSVSKVMAYSAAGIWAADIIWVLVKPVKSPVTQKTGRLKIVPGFDPGSDVPLLSLTYKF